MGTEGVLKGGKEGGIELVYRGDKERGGKRRESSWSAGEEDRGEEEYQRQRLRSMSYC